MSSPLTHRVGNNRVHTTRSDYPDPSRRSDHHHKYHRWLSTGPSLQLGDINNAGNGLELTGFHHHRPVVTGLIERTRLGLPFSSLLVMIGFLQTIHSFLSGQPSIVLNSFGLIVEIETLPR